MLKDSKILEAAHEEMALLRDDTCDLDRPLALQICGRDPTRLAKAVVAALDAVPKGRFDAIDLNLGCPQRCALRGGFGAYLAADPELAEVCVAAMVAAASNHPKHGHLPVWCKIRISVG